LIELNQSNRHLVVGGLAGMSFIQYSSFMLWWRYCNRVGAIMRGGCSGCMSWVGSFFASRRVGGLLDVLVDPDQLEVMSSNGVVKKLLKVMRLEESIDLR
jgi:hypothetical protein